MKQMIRILAVTLILVIALCPFALAGEIDQDAEGSVVMHMFYQGRPVTGGELRLVRVGDVQPDGSAYVLLPKLGGRTLTSEDLERPDTAIDLAADEAVRSLPYQTGSFDSSGEARFDQDIHTGLYLIIQTKACPGFQKMNPVLIPVPMSVAGQDGYDYDIDISVKPEPAPDEPEPTPDQPQPTPNQPEPTPDEPQPTPDQPEPTPDLPEPTPDQPVTPPSPGLPQTGQLNWPVPVMAGAGLLLILASIVLLSGKRKQGR